jgi:hypothetical protein
MVESNENNTPVEKVVPPRSRMGTIRPQILAAIMSGTVITIVALIVGMSMGAVEIITGVTGMVFGFLGGVSLKILENE